MEEWVTAPTPRILGGWEAPMQDLPAPGPQCTGSQGRQNVLGTRSGGGREAKAAPGTHTLHCTLTHPPCTIPTSCSQPSLSPLLPGIQMVSTMAPPPLEWARGPGQDLTTPIALLAPKSPCFSCCGVCPPPPLCLSSRPPRSSLSPCAPCSLLRSSPTNLSWPLSPHILPPICSSQGCPWASDGPLRLSLCLSVHLSLCLSLSCNLQ